MSEALPDPDQVSEPPHELASAAEPTENPEAPAAPVEPPFEPAPEVEGAAAMEDPAPVEQADRDLEADPDPGVSAPAEPRPPSRSTLKVRGASHGTNRPALIPPIPIPVDAIEPDDAFQLRDSGDIAGLATSLARVGQLFPIDVRPRGGSFQVVSGFRRLAAVKFLQRATVLARVHEDLSDSDAWAFALAQALESRGLTVEEIEAVRDRLEELGQLTAMNRGLIEAALTVPGSDLEPEEMKAPGAAEEVDLDELAADLELRLTGISADLSLITDLWSQLENGPRQALLDQLRYYAELHAYLSRLR